MGDVPSVPDYELPRSFTVEVQCMLHGIKSLRGTHDMFDLGHGRTYQQLGSVACTDCDRQGYGQRWLKLVAEIDPQGTVTETSADYVAALRADMEQEYGILPDEEPEASAPVAERVSTSVLPVSLINRPTL